MSFKELWEQGSVSAEELILTLQKYARTGLDISASVVIDLIERVKGLNYHHGAQLLYWAQLGSEKQKTKRSDSTHYDRVVNFLIG